MEKPILFSTPMVQAILEGGKKQTRRIIKRQPENTPNGAYVAHTPMPWMPYDIYYIAKLQDGNISKYWQDKSLYRKDDILWVRETFADTWTPDGQTGFVYKADGEPSKFPYWGNEKQCKDEVWIPSIHMPREAARIFLKVTNVKVQRLQDITELEAATEGVGKAFYEPNRDKPIHGDLRENYIDGFREAWNKIYKFPHTWLGNPWVWVVEFERQQ